MTNTAKTTPTVDYLLIALLTLVGGLVLVAALTTGMRAPITGTPSPVPSMHTYQMASELEDITVLQVTDDGETYADVEDAPEWFTEALLAAGFYGDPTDHHERLYAPAAVYVVGAPGWLIDSLGEAGFYGDPATGWLYAPVANDGI